jgi:squalene synthase HpnC
MDAHTTLQTIDAKAAVENFPVASRLLPARWRRHLLAIYGFARLVDDVGDEAPGDRLALLDAVDDDLDRVVCDGVPRLAVLRRLAPTVRACHLPLDTFHRLIEANRRDQTELRYQHYTDLLDYCTLSANPVGHLVLGVFGVADPERVALSDAVCTALQLVEHWQDVAEDAANGRIYLPAEDLRRFGCTAADLTGTETGPALRRLLAFEVSRAQALMTRGAPLVSTLSGSARIAVAGFVAGGQAALDALGAANFDVLSGPPRASRVRIARGTLTRLLARSAT